jgi:serine/threonine protein kinase
MNKSRKKIGSGLFGSIYLNQDKSVSKKSFNLDKQLQLLKKLADIDPDHIVKPLSQKIQIIPFRLKDYLNPMNYNFSVGGYMNNQYKMQYLDPLDGWYTLYQAITSMNIDSKIKEIWIKELTKAVKNLHKNYIAHNDLHGGNIMVNILTGQVKLLDFGLAKEFDKETWKYYCQFKKPLNFYDKYNLELLLHFINPIEYKRPDSYDIIKIEKQNCN